MMRQFDEVRQEHCYEKGMDVFREMRENPENRIVTTYRSPVLVGISWACRFSWKEVERAWYEQWANWREVCEVAEIAMVADFKGPKVKPTPVSELKRKLENAAKDGDWDTYHEHVPKELIDYAQRLCTPFVNCRTGS